MSILSERLKLLRIKSEKSQKQLAIQLSMKQTTYSNYETGDREPTFETLNKFADYYNVTADYLLGRTDYPNPSYAQMEGMGIESKTVDKLIKIKALLENPDYSQEFEDLVDRTNSLINSLNSGLQEVSNLRIPADAYYDFGYTTLEDETEQIITEITGVLRKIRRSGLKNIFQILKKEQGRA